MRPRSSLLLVCIGLALWLATSAPGCVPQLCGIDFECETPTPHCQVGQCVACIVDSHCPPPRRCLRLACRLPGGPAFEPSEESTSETPTLVDGSEPVSPLEVPPDVTVDATPDRTLPTDGTTPEKTLPEVRPEPEPTCKTGETRPCYTAKSGCTRPADGTFMCTAPCKAGIQVCKGGSWTSVCGGQVGPAEPLCDKADRNCDGKPDTCKRVAPTDLPLDYAVNEKGHLLAITRLSTDQGSKHTLKVHCATSHLSSAVPKTLILATTNSAMPTQTRTLTARIISVPGKDYFYLAWAISKFGPSFTSTLYVHTIDVNCKLLVGPRWQLASTQSFSMAADATGRLAMLSWHFQSNNGMFASDSFLDIYDEKGTRTYHTTLRPNNKGCLFPGHIAVNRKGQGVVACRDSVKPFPVLLHRFTMPSTKAAPITVPNSGTDTPTSIDPYLLPGINEKGDIVVQWQNAKLKKSYAYFRTAANKSLYVALSAIGGRTTTANTLYSLPTTAQVAVVGDDFILQDMPETTDLVGKWFRYNPAGTLVKQYTNGTFASGLRYQADFAYFLRPKTFLIFRAKAPF